MKKNKKLLVYFISCAFLLFALGSCRLFSGHATVSTTTPEITASSEGSSPVALTDTPAAPILTETPTPFTTETPAPSPTATQVEAVRFAVIGDYGEGSQGQADVASMIIGWDPDFIITTGDNNYPNGSAETIDEHIGKYYHSFIYPYKGVYGEGADRLRFFPTLGNHDYTTDHGQPYLDYFELPNNERYYDFSWGPVHFVALDSDSRTPEGVSQISTQAEWAKARLIESNAPWKVVYFHAPPYSSGPHGVTDWMRWPFSEWGASVVLCGHNHIYERLSVDGFTYFINGIGGGPIYAFDPISEYSQFRYNEDYGAMLVTADPLKMLFQFFNRQGTLIDSYQLDQP